MCIVCGPGSAHLLRALAGRSTIARPRLTAEAVEPASVPPLDLRDGTDLEGPADAILRGGPILTMSDAVPEAAAIAVRMGRIQAVGSEAEVLAHRGRPTRVIDLHGRAVLPGFVNAHWHMPFTLLCEWIGAPDPVAAWEAPPGEWIVVGAGIVGLDKIGPSHPVVMVDADGAVLAGNGLATADGKLPSHISGLLPRFPASPAAIRRRFAALLRRTAAAGVTCLRICGLGALTGTADLDLVRAAVAETSPLRLRAMLDAALLPGWAVLRLAPGFGDDFFRVDTLSAWPADVAAMLAAREAGWRLIVHAADAGQVQQALDSLAAAAPPPDGRSGLECRTMPHPAQLAAMQHLGLSLGLLADECEAAVPSPELPVSLGLDAADGFSAPLQMVRHARAAGLSLQRALAAVTIDAARRCGAGDILGSLERGKYADLVFLDGDPRSAIEPQCCDTWINGYRVAV